jgi:hypothetical protein
MADNEIHDTNIIRDRLDLRPVFMPRGRDWMA